MWAPDMRRLQNTLVARLYLILIICVVVVPVKIVMTALFTSGGTVVVPSHWGVRQLPSKKPMDATGILQAVAFVLYGVFINLQKLNKAVTGLLLIGFMAVTNPIACLGKSSSVVSRTFNEMIGSTALEHSASNARRTWRAILCRCLLLPIICGLWLIPKRIFGNSKDAVAHCLTMLLWILCLWILMTYGTLLNSIMGSEAAPTVIQAWGWGIFFEQFGEEGLRILTMRVGVAWITSMVQQQIRTGAHHNQQVEVDMDMDMDMDMDI